jgi:hypothetical protein
MLKKCVVLVLLAACLPLPSITAPQRESDSSTSEKLTAMLRQFLVDAAQGNVAGFESFFADDVIYTRSAGVVTNKAEILKSVANLRPTPESKTTMAVSP